MACTLAVAVGALYLRSAVLDDTGTSMAGGVHVPGTDVVVGAGSASLSKGNTGDTHAIWPPVPPDAGERPLGAPPAQNSSSGGFAFLRTVGDSGGSRPVAWDPCRPIHLVVNGAAAPRGSDQLLREATAQVSSATGLQFVFDGPTTEAPSRDRAPQDNDRYGNRWSPVLVAWTDPAVVPDLAGSVAGLAGPEEAPYYVASQEHWVSGRVNLDGPDLAEVLKRPGGWGRARAVVMHELGHLVGMAHVHEPTELMYPEATAQTAFGPGDQEGLRQLGLGPCFTD
ncbi:MAG TPA: matrixin family metalloprotease [Flexivirga sp.]|uniref:matrixin family metalloprotease n=1 Tax=Flexivirga sp. TaxID=1962927 RepID=UPI002C81347F|nr:matrixin family metalloprotease [Flexivirga sp.]HWC24634.1 matrixin family metalloprotease [Flexivirga sp.]